MADNDQLFGLVHSMEWVPALSLLNSLEPLDAAAQVFYSSGPPYPGVTSLHSAFSNEAPIPLLDAMLRASKADPLQRSIMALTDYYGLVLHGLAKNNNDPNNDYWPLFSLAIRDHPLGLREVDGDGKTPFQLADGVHSPEIVDQLLAATVALAGVDYGALGAIIGEEDVEALSRRCVGIENLDLPPPQLTEKRR
jgi:hypothetical protein